MSTYFHFLLHLLCSGVAQNAAEFYKTVSKYGLDDNNLSATVTTINGRVFVNWTTNGPLPVLNTTVYFLTNYTDINNTSNQVNISICHARKLSNNTWLMEPSPGNFLLNFCKHSGLCGPFDANVTSLVNARWISKLGELSCELFTTCSNFNNSYAIEILTSTKETTFSLYFDNLIIYYQNIPPAITNQHLSDQSPNNAAVILWDYPDASELCGFGQEPSENIVFVIQYFKLNESHHCYPMGERTFGFNENNATFNNLMSTDTNKYSFYLNAKFLINNRTSKFWRKQNFAEPKDKRHVCEDSIHNGALKVWWRPDWDCFDTHTTHQILFCPPEEIPNCIPICELSLLRNGSVTEVLALSKNMLNFCSRHSDTCEMSKVADKTDLVDAYWDIGREMINCTTFKYCSKYLAEFRVKIRSFSKTFPQRFAENLPCKKTFVNRIRDNHPSAPTNVTVVFPGKSNVTLIWQYHHCQWISPVFVVFLNDEDIHVEHQVIKISESEYGCTIASLTPFTSYDVQLVVKGKINKMTSPRTDVVNFRTKQAAPLRGPVIMSNERRNNSDINITWQLPSSEDLRGIPTQYHVTVYNDDEMLIWNDTLYGGNLTSTMIDGHNVPKCDTVYIYLRVCNGPHLCSPRSEVITSIPDCPNNNNGSGSSFFSGSNKIWVIVVCMFALVILISAVVVAAYWKRKKTKHRERLPSLSGVALTNGSDYSDIGLPNEYCRL